MKNEKEKQLLYDLQREKDSQKQVNLIKTFVASKYDLKDDIFKKYDKNVLSKSAFSQEWIKTYDKKVSQDWKTKIVPTNPVAQINESSSDEDSPRLPHKFAVGTKIQFPTFEKLRLEGWMDDGEYIVHPNYKTIYLSYLQIADFEDTVVTISHQNNPGEYSIKEDGLYDDWPFDLMNVVNLFQPTRELDDKQKQELRDVWYPPVHLINNNPKVPVNFLPEKLEFDDQSLQEQVFHILHYLESEPNQMIIPDGRVRLLKETLGDYKPYNEVCYLPLIKRQIT